MLPFAMTGSAELLEALPRHETAHAALLADILDLLHGRGRDVLVSLYKVAERDSGVASSLLNAGQEIGGAIGLALLGTVAWAAVADSVRSQVAQAAAAAERAGRPLPKPGAPLPTSIYHHALTVGFSLGFVGAAGIALLALLIGIVAIRVSRQELAAAGPEPPAAAPEPVTAQPGTGRTAALESAALESGTGQEQEEQAAFAAAIRPCRFC